MKKSIKDVPSLFFSVTSMCILSLSSLRSFRDFTGISFFPFLETIMGATAGCARNICYM